MDPTPFFLIHAVVAGLATYVMSFYRTSKRDTIWDGCMIAVLLSFIWTWVSFDITAAWRDLFVEVPGTIVFGRLIFLVIPHGEDIMGLIGGWLVPFSVSWAVATLQFRKPARRERIGLKQRVIFYAILALTIAYWISHFELPE